MQIVLSYYILATTPLERTASSSSLTKAGEAFAEKGGGRGARAAEAWGVASRNRQNVG